MSESGSFKRSMQPTKRLKRRKCAQTALHISHSSQTLTPLIIPSDALQAPTNQSQTMQLEPIQPRTLRPRAKRSHHQIQPTRPRPRPRPQPQPQPTPTQPQCPEPQLIPTQVPSVPEFSMVNQMPLDAVEAHTNQSQTIQFKPIQSRTVRPRTQRSRPQIQSTQPQPQPRPQIQPTQPDPTQPQCSQLQPQPQSQSTQPQPVLLQIPRVQEFTMVNQLPSSSSDDSGDNNGNKIMILPEADGFNEHRLVIRTIAAIIRSKFDEAQPSWKKISKGHRDMWFDMFKSKFTWPSEHDDVVRRNFEKRGSVKMTQLMQDVRKNLDWRPNWIKEPVWTQMKAYWESSSFKEKSEINKRNHAALAGASLHTGGSVPHRLHWKRMMEEKGTNPSLADFYCRTHRKKDHSWVGTLAKSAYEKYEQRKSELSLQSSTFPLGDNDEGQQSMPSELDIWVKSVGGMKKGRRIFGLRSIEPKNLLSNPKDLVAMRSHVQALKDSLQRRESENLELRKELSDTKMQLAALMRHLGFVGSSDPLPSSQHSDEDDDNDDEEDDDDGDSDYAN